METKVMDKEDLVHVKFTNEAAHDPAKHEHIMNDLLRAQSLGNLEKVKVRIEFLLDDHSSRAVETTVWAVGPDHIMLKGGVTIPIRAIELIAIS